MPANVNTGLGDQLRDRLRDDVRDLAGALGEHAAAVAARWVTEATERLTRYAEQGGGPGLVAAATGIRKLADGQSPAKAMLGAGLAGGKEKVMRALGADRAGRSGRSKLKVTNIVETIEVGVPVRVAYNQWTRYEDFPSFMKKVENVERESDEKTTWKAQVFWSHRSWESTVIRQIPDRLVHWRSKGEKGHVDGTVSFHEVAPDLTRILVVLEYHPQGFFEHTGNLWRAQGRRVRLELKHFVRHVMTQVVLDPDQVEGWRGEIRDGRVVKDHEAALREERGEPEERDDGDEPEREPRGRAPEQRRRGERGGADDEEYDDYADEYDEDEEYDEEPEEEPEPERRPRTRAAAGARRTPGDGQQLPRPRPVRRTAERPRRPVRRREERG